MSGLLHVGDVIKEINGQEVLRADQLQELMKKYNGTITFKIIPASQDQNSSMKVAHLCSLLAFDLSSSIIAGAQSTLGEDTFLCENMCQKLTNCPNFTVYLSEKYFSRF